MADDPGPNRCLAVIPARGGSKGLPRKNVRLLAGVPLISRAVQVACQAKSVTRVVVTTDDVEIGQVAQNSGADVVWRPAELATDAASSESAVLHVLRELEDSEGYRPEKVVMMQCTAPLTTASDIDGAVEHLERSHADSCFTAVPFLHFLWRVDQEGMAVGINHSGSKRARRQDLPLQLLENGAVYVMRTDAFVASGDRFCGKLVAWEVPADRQLEIDDPRDFLVAEALLSADQTARSQEWIPRPLHAVVFDFDGVMTDDRVYVDESGIESVCCHRGDGHGISLLRQLNLPLLVLSREGNPVVARRAEKLRIECLSGITDKLPVLRQWLAGNDATPSQVIYVGNDVTDVECMSYVGCPVCPADAHPAARAAARIVLTKPGGRGALRELCDLLLEGRLDSRGV